MLKLVIMLLLFTSSSAMSDEIHLDSLVFRHVVTGNKATSYTFKDNVLYADVDNSSSLMFQPFSEKKVIRTVSFVWKAIGQLNIPYKKLEKTKSGDDGLMRVGLLISGDSTPLQLRMKSWARDVDTIHPFKSIFLLTAGSKHKLSEHWISPYSKHIEVFPTVDTPLGKGWFRSTISFQKSIVLSGMFIIADGDNSRSKFMSAIKEVKFK